jgi:heme/copper-type cytochrome/quinol oxidase subunit 1
MIGARDMAFPRLNAFTYWSFLLSGLFLYGSLLFLNAPHGGWFAYTPYTTAQYSPGYGMDFYALALIFLTISTTAGAINFIVTIFRLRAPGMAISRMPLFLYSTTTISFAVVMSLPALTVACIFLELDRRWGTHFFDVARGGWRRAGAEPSTSTRQWTSEAANPGCWSEGSLSRPSFSPSFSFWGWR